MHPPRLITALFGFLLLLGFTVSVAQDSPKSDRVLKILLTNDDGYDAPGIQAVRKALLAAAHEVTVVAPLQKQSGASAKITSREAIGLQEQAPGVWSVDGTPADCVSIGLQRILAQSPPDLVVSGANFGQNLGADVHLSGTVGATIMALRLGTPAIAVSVGIKAKEANAKPERYPSTFASFAPASAFVAKLILQLQESRLDGVPLLPANTLLNVNFPPVGSEPVQGSALASVSRERGFRFRYEDAETPNAVKAKVTLVSPSAAEPGSDHAFYAKDFITVSVLNASLDGSKASVDAVSARLPFPQD